MKVVIAGSRTLDDREDRLYVELQRLIDRFKSSYGPITLVVSGTARGPDRLGEKWAVENGVPIARFPAKWDLYGNAAGPIRNQEMGDFGDGGIVMWDGESNGAKHMSEVLRKQNKPFILDTFAKTVYYDHQPSGKIQVGFHNPKDNK